VKPTILTTVLLAFICQATAQVIYVHQGASGAGTSWSDASNDLVGALEVATPGTQVWVAAGSYNPAKDNDRAKSFVVPNGVSLIGGFKGTETSIEDRKIGSNQTVLSGEIGAPGIADNSYNVLLIKNANETTIVDGFLIKGGNANGDVKEAGKMRCGGGLYIDGQNGSSKPIIRNCGFVNNYGRDGAAVYNNGRDGESSPQFVNCTFKGNEAGLDGGAVYNDGRVNGKTNPVFVDCKFEKNLATYGGAICNASEAGVCNLTLENCSFESNEAFLRGGAVFSLNGDQKCYLEMQDCTFSANYPDDQNMVFTSNSSRSKAFQVSRTEQP